jgi:hypothetical protein
MFREHLAHTQCRAAILPSRFLGRMNMRADTGAYAADARTSKGVRRNAPSGAAVPERVNETARRFTPGGIFPMAAP